jgi:head-tail adaptor
MMIDPGLRDRSVVIQSRPVTDEVDTAGFPSPTWTALCTMWARKHAASGQERERYGQTTAAAVDVFEVNYRADLDPELLDVPKLRRVLFNSRIHDIVWAETVDRRDGIRLVTLTGQKVTS